MKKIKKLGYNISHQIINCADYGPSNSTKIFIGFRKDLGKFTFPNPTHSNQDRDDNLFFAPWVTCKEAIGDLDYPLKEDKEKIQGLKIKNY